MNKKTKRQSEILDFLSHSIITEGRSPTLDEIASHFSFSVPAAHYAVESLKKKGYIEVDKDKRRSIRLTEGERDLRENIPVPFFEKEPTKDELQGESENSIMAERKLGENIFAYRVTSQSMINSGIIPGDIAFMRRTDKADDEDIVLALKDDDGPLVLRRIHITSSYTELWAENDTIGIIRRKNFPIYGKLIEVRRYY